MMMVATSWRINLWSHVGRKYFRMLRRNVMESRHQRPLKKHKRKDKTAEEDCNSETLITFQQFVETLIGKKNWKALAKLHKIDLSFIVGRKFHEELCSFEGRSAKRNSKRFLIS